MPRIVINKSYSLISDLPVVSLAITLVVTSIGASESMQWHQSPMV